MRTSAHQPSCPEIPACRPGARLKWLDDGLATLSETGPRGSLDRRLPRGPRLSRAGPPLPTALPETAGPPQPLPLRRQTPRLASVALSAPSSGLVQDREPTPLSAANQVSLTLATSRRWPRQRRVRDGWALGDTPLASLSLVAVDTDGQGRVAPSSSFLARLLRALALVRYHPSPL